MQLEKAIHTPSPSSSTYKAIMETKDARIATLEKEVALLEREIQRYIAKESGSSLHLFNAGSPLFPAAFAITPSAMPSAVSRQMMTTPLPPLLPLPAPMPPPIPPPPPLPQSSIFQSQTPHLKHTDTSFKRQVSFLLNNVQIRKDGKVTVIM